MAREAQGLTGLQIELDIKTQDLGLSSKEDFNLYRIFQEAITNTILHTNAKRAQISISGNRELVSFSYWDNGAGINKIEAGNGLKGMNERMAELGGAIVFQSQIDNGFKINGYIDRRRVKNEDN